MVTVVNANDVALENSSLIVGDKMVQESAVSLSLYLDGELRNMGFGVPDSTRIVLVADSTTLTYRVSQPPFDNIDTVSFLPRTHSRISPPLPMRRTASSTGWKRSGAPSRLPSSPICSSVISTGSVRLSRLPSRSRCAARSSKWRCNGSPEFVRALQAASQVQPGQPDALYSSFIFTQTRLAAQNIRVAPPPAQRPDRHDQPSAVDACPRRVRRAPEADAPPQPRRLLCTGPAPSRRRRHRLRHRRLRRVLGLN